MWWIFSTFSTNFAAMPRTLLNSSTYLLQMCDSNLSCNAVNYVRFNQAAMYTLHMTQGKLPNYFNDGFIHPQDTLQQCKIKRTRQQIGTSYHSIYVIQKCQICSLSGKTSCSFFVLWYLVVVPSYTLLVSIQTTHVQIYPVVYTRLTTFTDY